MDARPNPTDYHSRFGGLWIDKLNAPVLIEQKLRANEISDTEAAQLRQFIQDGYLILEGAVPHEVVDQLNAELDAAWENLDDRIKVQTAHGAYKKLADVPRDQTLVKLLDAYVFSDAAIQATFSPPILAFLHLIFNDDVLAFQNLTFEVGSTQAMHRDGAYVVVNSPLEFAASWIAREDIHPGSGELVYYPGSHRFPDFLFGPDKDRMSWHPDRDGQAIHRHFLHWLHQSAKERGIKRKHFLPKKGDALIWHAGLAHGGGPIANGSLTRQSYVTHYCPKRVSPNYFRFAPERAKTAQVGPNAFISSWFYDLVKPSP